MAEYGLGRKKEHDPRSRNFRVMQLSRNETPNVVFWEHFGVVLNQKNLGACTGFAGTHCLMTAPFRKRERTLYSFFAKNLYSQATELDQWEGTWPPDDTGSSGLAVMKAMQARGYIKQYIWGFGIDDLDQGLANGPMMVGTDWHESMFDPDQNGLVTVSGSAVGGHEYLCLGRENDYYHFLNSWSRYWGVPSKAAHTSGGSFWMQRGDFARLLENGGDCVQPVIA
jgi:hypothetical protein